LKITDSRRRTHRLPGIVRGAAFIAALSLVAARVLAQATGVTTGDLRGEVRDESGAPLAGVSVAAVNPGTGLARTGSTGSGGEFVLRLLPPGSYDVTALQEGLQTLRVERVVVVVGSTAYLELTMRVQPVAEAVIVDAGSRPTDLASTELATAVTQTEIRNLPINRRNFLDFALTTPGVTADRGPQTGAATTSGFSVNGQSPRSNNVMMDGLDNNDAAVGAVRTSVTQEAVLEYQVIRAPYSPEYGRAGGGVINVATRSGSNDLRGSAFLFYRDQDLSASNALSGTKNPYEQFQYGGTISGPALAERLFFFAAAERLDVTDSNVVTIDEEDAATIRGLGFPVVTGVLPYDRGRTSVFARLDTAPTGAQAWALRGAWATESDENQQPWGGLVARSGGGVRDIQDWSAGATGISLFGSGASNELRAQYAERRHRLESLDETGGPSVEILGVATLGTQVFLPQPRDSTIFQVFDALSFFRDRTTAKVGVEYIRTRLQGSLPLYFAGRYRFEALPAIPGVLPVPLSALEAFAAGIPSVFVQGFGDPEREVGTDLLAAFAQAEWTLVNRLLVRAGLRYDYEKPAAPFPADSNNWAPRLSFAWAPGPIWRVRGGLGRFYAVAPTGPLFAVGVQDGVAARTYVRTILGGPSPAEPWLLPDRRFASEADAGASALPPTILDRGEFESAYTDLGSIGVEAEIGRGWSASLDYVHARGQAILVERNINPILPAGTRPDPAYYDVLRYESTGNSWYDGITLAVQTGVGGPLRLASSFTYADAEDDFIDFAVGQPQDPLDPESERGPTIHVPKYRATLAAVYSTPSSGAWWSRDWTLSAISDLSIGRPLNELAGFDRNANGDGFSDRPEGVGRNQSTLPAYWNVDLRVGRRIPVGPLDLELTLEFFNLLDRENVLEVNAVRYLSPELDENPEFGEATRVADPRRLQVGARLRF